MRNRFLAADYFTTGGSVQTLDFIRLPLPHLPPPNDLSFSQHFLHSFHDIPVFSITCEIEKLPIDHARSKLFSDVLPHVIDEVNFSEHEIGSTKGNRTVLISEDDFTPDHGGRSIIEITQFEIPEMDLSLLQSQESAIQSQMEDLDILSQSQSSVAECTMDMPTSDLSLPNLLEIQQSVYSVDDMSLEYSMKQKADFLEDVSSFEGELHFHNIHFPPFEVDEESLGIVRSIRMEDELLDFENIEPQHLTELDVVLSDSKELLSSIEFDLNKYLSEHCLAVQCLEVELHCSNFSSQMDYLSVVEQPHYEYSTYHQGKAGGDIIRSVNLCLFEEFQFFDQDPSYSCEFFSDAAKEVEEEPCEFMFGENMNFMNFGELIVCHELTLMDDSFKSLPVPIISGHENIRSLHSMVEQILAQVESQSSSTSDGLYLDWHFLEEDNFGKYSSCRKMPWEIDTYKIDSSNYLMGSTKQIYDFILSKDCSDKPNTEDCKEMLNLPSAVVSMFHTSVDGKKSDSWHNHVDRKRLNGDLLLETSIEKVPSFVESMSSDLEFFLNPRNYVTGKECKPADKSVDIITTYPLIFSNDDSVSNATTMVQQQWNVRFHRVQLSENILLLIDSFCKVFLALLENNTELRQSQSLGRAGENLTVLCLPKEELMDLLKKRNAPSTHSAHNDDNTMLLMMLCAIKQMAFYLCYYGVHATYLYVDRLCRNLQCLKSRLSCLYNLIKNANQRAEKEIWENHPSLSVVHEILQTNLSSGSSKILIVADRVFWWPLKRLLTSMKISCNELHHFSGHASQQGREFTNTILNSMLSTDSCLVSYEYVSASFPFHEFGFVLEYGGSNGSSIISTICPKLDQLPPLYFLKVELEDSSVSKALSCGVCISKNSEFKMDADIHSTSAQNESKNKLEDLLNFVPIEDTYNKGLVKDVNEDEVCSVMPVESMPVAMESKEINLGKPFPHDIVIIVNTQNFDKEMVISQRRTYQRILALEKEGAQVVERDIDLPVDIIVSAAICLAWYDCRNIGKKASAPDEAFSCLPLCIESIAASTLTSMSFAFSCCILIFEGEGSFLSGIMESSDELYAAAASLGIDIQLFCSFSSDMTSEIILSCIEVGIKSHRGLCPKMSDSESLAESFLTAFPSINPLSAHAILSSGSTLVEFLDLSDKDRTCALQKFNVPDESIAFLNATSRYGVREDSKSGMTDCSSSVSSAPDSETAQFRSASDRKKLKYTHNLYDAIEPPNDLFHMDPLKLFSDDLLHPPNASTSCDSWLSGSTEKFDESGKSSLSFDDKLFCNSQGLDIDTMMKSSTVSRFHDFPNAKDLEILAEIEKPTMAEIGVNYDPRSRSGKSTTINFSRKNTKACGYLKENLIGEVIDIDDTPTFRNYIDRSPFMLDGETDYAARLSKPPSGVSKGSVFTDPVEIDSASDAWVSIRDSRQNSRGEIGERFDAVENNKISLKCQKRLFQDDVTETNSQNSYKISFQEKGSRNYGGTPLSNALRSTEPQQGSPWTIEFLNRIREKSRLRQQSIPCNLSSPQFNYSRNASKVTKRKSPSILEFYKYQGGSASEKIVEEKRQRRSSQQSNSSKNKKGSASCQPSLTPIDKRASRTLSFATNGNGGQSKLIWSDKSSHTFNKRC